MYKRDNKYSRKKITKNDVRHTVNLQCFKSVEIDKLKNKTGKNSETDLGKYGSSVYDDSINRKITYHLINDVGIIGSSEKNLDRFLDYIVFCV